MTVALPAYLTLALPSDDEAGLIRRMSDALGVYSQANTEAAAYYEGSFVTRQFGISIPPSMQGLATPAGWPGTVVDVLEERLDWLGWVSEGDDFGLPAVYAANQLDVDSGMTHLDSLIFGTSFVVIGSGGDGEPSPLITAHSPQDMTALWDPRTRRVGAALSLSSSALSLSGQSTEATLYLPNETTVFERVGSTGQWIVVDRDRHLMGRLPVVMFPNRVRGSRTEGRSEITKAVRYYTDAAVRTLLGLEVNREFYNAPQRVALNVEESMFQDASGAAVSQWTAIMGRVWMIPPSEDPDGPQPSVQQFSPASPAPYIDQIRGYAQLLSAEGGLPGAYLGFHTENPSSADAIRAGEARLVKRAERRITTFDRRWLEVGRVALMVRDGGIPDTFDTTVSGRWRDPATSTRAASADEAVKLIGGGVLPPDSTVTYDRIGLSPAEQRQVAADKRRGAGRDVLAGLAALTAVPQRADNAPAP